MAEDKKSETSNDKTKGFEVEELSDESLDSVAGGIDADAGITSDAPGNNCTNNATGC